MSSKSFELGTSFKDIRLIYAFSPLNLTVKSVRVEFIKFLHITHYIKIGTVPIN